MDTESLADFVALASCKSFSKAAASRRVTQPAFSRRIRALEKELGADLVDRAAKDFQLTVSGERFLVHAQAMIDLAARAAQDARNLTTRLRQPIYLSMPSYISRTFFPTWYRAMQKRIPGLALRVSNQRGPGTFDDLRRGLVDFSLVIAVEKIGARNDLSGLAVRVVARDRFVAVRAKIAAKADGLLMYEQGSYMNRCAEAVLGKKVSANPVVFEASSTGLLREMALAGFGIAVVPESLVEDDIREGFLVPVAGTHPLDVEVLLVRDPKPASKKAEKLWASA